jgi:hypothetical protein
LFSTNSTSPSFVSLALGAHSMLFSFFFLLGLSILVMAVPLDSQRNGIPAAYSSRGYDIPIQRRRIRDMAGAKLKRDGLTGSVNLGDDDDL